MKKLFVLCLFMFAGCAQLQHGQAPDKPKVIDASTNLMSVDCSGPANTIGVCYGAAGQSCSAGYEVVDKIEDLSGSARRLTFKCK